MTAATHGLDEKAGALAEEMVLPPWMRLRLTARCLSLSLYESSLLSLSLLSTRGWWQGDALPVDPKATLLFPANPIARCCPQLAIACLPPGDRPPPTWRLRCE